VSRGQVDDASFFLVDDDDGNKPHRAAKSRSYRVFFSGKKPLYTHSGDLSPGDCVGCFEHEKHANTIHTTKHDTF
jgi:hypothetical protein